MSKFLGYWLLHGTGLLTPRPQPTETPTEHPPKAGDQQDAPPFRGFRHPPAQTPPQR